MSRYSFRKRTISEKVISKALQTPLPELVSKDKHCFCCFINWKRYVEDIILLDFYVWIASRIMYSTFMSDGSNITRFSTMYLRMCIRSFILFHLTALFAYYHCLIMIIARLIWKKKLLTLFSSFFFFYKYNIGCNIVDCQKSFI